MASKIALLQVNSIVGDISGNANKVCKFSEQASKAGASLAVTTELANSGYPPRDLLLQSDFIRACHDTASTLESVIPILVGTPVPSGLPFC